MKNDWPSILYDYESADLFGAIYRDAGVEQGHRFALTSGIDVVELRTPIQMGVYNVHYIAFRENRNEWITWGLRWHEGDGAWKAPSSRAESDGGPLGRHGIFKKYNPDLSEDAFLSELQDDLTEYV